MKYILAFLFVTSSTALHADIYRWKDTDGVQHYGDKPSGKAENITADMRKINVAPSQQAQQQAIAALRQEDAEPASVPSSMISIKKAKACADAKELLRKLSGRVVMLDKDGRSMPYTAEQRQNDAAALKVKVEKHCAY